MIARGLREAGYYIPYEGGHTLRRSGATALYNQLTHVGHDRAIRICQAMLGHSSVSRSHSSWVTPAICSICGAMVTGLSGLFRTHIENRTTLPFSTSGLKILDPSSQMRLKELIVDEPKSRNSTFFYPVMTWIR